MILCQNLSRENGSQEAVIESSDVLLDRTKKSQGGTAGTLMKIETHALNCCLKSSLFCFKWFRESSANAFETALSQGTTKFVVLIDETTHNPNREHTVCFEMPDIAHYYIGLTVHDFSDFICDDIGNVFDCYVLHSQPLEGPFVPFNLFNPLEVF